MAGEDSEEEGKEWEAFATGRKKRPGSGGDGDAEAGKLPGGSGSEDETGGTGEDWMDSDDVRGKRKKHEYKEVGVLGENRVRLYFHVILMLYL